MSGFSKEPHNAHVLRYGVPATEYKPALPEIISISPGPFHVTVTWHGLDNIPADSVMQIQFKRDSRRFAAPSILSVKADDKYFLIDGLAAGEEVECRLQVITPSGGRSGWSEYIKQSASSDVSACLDAILASSTAVQGEASALSSISIEEQTLSAVLIGMLPSHRVSEAEYNAKTIARAVKQAFAELRTDYSEADDPAGSRSLKNP